MKMASTAIHASVCLDLMERTARTVSIFILRVSCDVCAVFNFIVVIFFMQTLMIVLHHRVQTVVPVLTKSTPINVSVYLDTLEKIVKLVSLCSPSFVQRMFCSQVQHV